MASSLEILDQQELYDALANERRRSCLRQLASSDSALAAGDLATNIAREMSNGEGFDDSVKQSTYISLIQSHLPKLHEYEVIEYDADEKLVRQGPAFEEAYACLRVHGHDEAEFDHRKQFLLVSAVTALGLVAALVVTQFQAYLLVGLLLIHAAALIVLYT